MGVVCVESTAVDDTIDEWEWQGEESEWGGRWGVDVVGGGRQVDEDVIVAVVERDEEVGTSVVSFFDSIRSVEIRQYGRFPLNSAARSIFICYSK